MTTPEAKKQIETLIETIRINLSYLSYGIGSAGDACAAAANALDLIEHIVRQIDRP